MPELEQPPAATAPPPPVTQPKETSVHCETQLPKFGTLTYHREDGLQHLQVRSARTDIGRSNFEMRELRVPFESEGTTFQQIRTEYIIRYPRNFAYNIRVPGITPDMTDYNEAIEIRWHEDRWDGASPKKGVISIPSKSDPLPAQVYEIRENLKPGTVVAERQYVETPTLTATTLGEITANTPATVEINRRLSSVMGDAVAITGGLERSVQYGIDVTDANSTKIPGWKNLPSEAVQTVQGFNEKTKAKDLEMKRAPHDLDFLKTK